MYECVSCRRLTESVNGVCPACSLGGVLHCGHGDENRNSMIRILREYAKLNMNPQCNGLVFTNIHLPISDNGGIRCDIDYLDPLGQSKRVVGVLFSYSGLCIAARRVGLAISKEGKITGMHENVPRYGETKNPRGAHIISSRRNHVSVY